MSAAVIEKQVLVLEAEVEKINQSLAMVRLRKNIMMAEMSYMGAMGNNQKSFKSKS